MTAMRFVDILAVIIMCDSVVLHFKTDRQQRNRLEARLPRQARTPIFPNYDDAQYANVLLYSISLQPERADKAAGDGKGTGSGYFSNECRYCQIAWNWSAALPLRAALGD